MMPIIHKCPSFRSLAAITLLFFYIIGPFAISAQFDHLLVAEQNLVKFLDYDAADSIFPSIFQNALKIPAPFQQKIHHEIRLSSGTNPITLRSSRAPPVTHLYFFQAYSSNFDKRITT